MMVKHPCCDTVETDDRVVLWPCAAVLLVCILAVTVLAAWPRTGAQVAIVFPPWLTLAQIDDRITAAGGALIDFGVIKWVVVGLSDDPDFAQRLYGHGAIWAMDGTFAAGLCVVPSV
jgi:hypothetical protein